MQEENVPVYILGPNAHPMLLPYFADNQTYIFTNSLIQINNQHNYDDFYVLCYKQQFDLLLNSINKERFEILSTFDSGVHPDSGDISITFGVARVRRIRQ
jgi:hypothetical protein